MTNYRILLCSKRFQVTECYVNIKHLTFSSFLSINFTHTVRCIMLKFGFVMISLTSIFSKQAFGGWYLLDKRSPCNVCRVFLFSHCLWIFAYSLFVAFYTLYFLISNNIDLFTIYHFQ